MKYKVLRHTFALGIAIVAFAAVSPSNDILLKKQEMPTIVGAVKTPCRSANIADSTDLKAFFAVPEANAEEELEKDKSDNSGGEGIPTSEAARWGRIREIELTAPIASLSIKELLAISLGSMHRDIVRDGLPWFDAVRDDFKKKPRRHRGLDFYGEDLAIRAMADGKVAVRSNAKNAGYYVVIDHGGGVETLYMHLREVYGGPSRVRRGDLLGITGISGNAISPQLHLGIRLDKTYIDPIGLLKEAADKDTIDVISYYESLFLVKSRARKHFVTAYLADDIETKRIETEWGIRLLRTISHDDRVSEWLKQFGGE